MFCCVTYSTALHVTIEANVLLQVTSEMVGAELCSRVARGGTSRRRRQGGEEQGVRASGYIGE